MRTPVNEPGPRPTAIRSRSRSRSPASREQVLDAREAPLQRVLAPAGRDVQARAVVERRGEPVQRRVKRQDLHACAARARAAHADGARAVACAFDRDLDQAGGSRPAARSGHSTSAMRSGAKASSSARSGSSAAGSSMR